MRIRLLPSLVVALALAGCQDCARSNTIHIALPVEKPVVAKLDVNGEVERFAGEAAATGHVYLLWDLPNEDGAVFRYGDAPLGADGRFGLHLDTAAPGAALTDDVVGVANLVVVPSGVEVPAGPLEGEPLQQLLPKITAATGTYVVVDKRNDAKHLPWLAAFPKGLACGRSRPMNPLRPKEARGFEPVDCGEVRLSPGLIDNVEFTPWYKPPRE